MSSSFVRDCSDSSSSNANSSNKTLIIIVNNDSSGNVALDGNELQNILASHGANESSEVSVVQMGHHGTCPPETLTFPANLPPNDASNLMSHAVMPLNFTVDGFPSFALEGATVGGCYAELPLDADALRRLERVLETEEAREFLGEPLLDIVNNPDDLLDPFEQMMSPSDDAASSNEGSPVKFKRSAPKRRSQRQMDKAERDEVVKILAENQRMLQQERELFKKLKEEREEEERREGDINYVDENGLTTIEHTAEDKFNNVSTCAADGMEKKISIKTVEGKGKKFNVTQEGKGKKVKIVQDGKGKKLNVTQEEKEKKLNVTQEGKGKMLNVTQEGKGKKLNVTQEGKGKKLYVTQEGKGKELGVRGKGIKNISTEQDTEEQENTIEKLSEITGKFKGGKVKSKLLEKVSFAHSRNDKSKIIKEMPMKRLSVKVKKLDAREIEITYDEKYSETLGGNLYSKTNLTSKSPVKLEQAESTVASSQSIKIHEPYINTIISSVSSPPESIRPDRLNQRLMSPQRGHLKQPKSKNRKMVVVKSKSSNNPRYPPGSRSERTFSNSYSPEFNMQSELTDKSKTCDVNRPDTLSSELSDNVKLKTSSNILMTNKNFSDVDPMLSSLETLSTHTVTSTTSTLSPPRRKIQVVTPSEAKSVVDICANLSSKKVPIASTNNTACDEAADSKFKEEKIKKNVLQKDDNVKKAKISFENMLNLGNFASKTSKNSLKINTKIQENVLPPIKSPNNLLQHSPSISKSLMNYKIPLKNSTIRKSLEFKENSTSRKSIEFKENSCPSPQNSTLFLKNSYLSTPVFYNKTAKKSTSDIESSPPSTPSNKCLKNDLGTDSISTKDFKCNDSQNNCSILQKNNKQSVIELKSGQIDESLTTIKVQPKKVKTFPPYVNTTNVKNVDTPPIKSPALKIVQTNSINNISAMATKSVNNDVTGSLPNQSVRRSVRPVKKKRFDDDIFYLGKNTTLPKKVEEREESSDDSDSEEEKNVSFDNPRVETIDSSSENSDIDIVDDDPERLWCLCQKPHNNRFMICCDRCEDWFHGSCVGVSKQLGKEMEERECEWICPNCKKAERATKGIPSPPPMKVPSKGFDLNDSSAGVNKKTASKKGSQRTEPRVLMYEKTTGIVLSGSAAPVLDALPDFLGSHPNYSCLTPDMMSQMVQDPETGVKRIPLELLGVTQTKKSKLSSFQEKIDSANSKSSKKDKSFRSTKFLEHSEVIKLEHEPPKKTEKSTSKKSSKTSQEKSSKKMNTSVFYSKDPESVKKHSSLNKVNSESVKKHSTDKTEESPSSKKHAKESKKASKAAPDSVDKVIVKSDSIVLVRSSVQKMLLEALDKRRTEAKGEFKELTLEHLKILCKEIEEQLYLIFNKDVGFKYKSRYRSLVFNIRDTKNGGLFRNILNGSIPPEKLACLTSEEMASKELIEWREQEEKKELEAIQKHELERIALGNQYIMKSHKGEIMIDNDELGKKNKDTDSVINLAPDQSKSLPPKDLQEDEALTNHKNHIYDPNCHICANSELHEFALSRSKEETNKESSKSGRVSSQEKEKKDRRNREHSKHKKKDKERHRELSKEKSPSKHSRHKDKHKEKLSSSSDESKKERRKHRDNEKGSYEEHRKHRKDSHSSREDVKSKDHKRRHSESRSDDRKRRDVESLNKRSLEGGRKRQHRESEREQSPRRKESEYDRERSPKARDSLERDLHPSESKVSTSDDVVFVSQNSSDGELMDVKDVEPTSTVVGSPVNEYGSDMAALSPAESIPYPEELENENSISDQRETLVPSSDSLDVSPSTTPPLPNDNDNDNEIEEIFSPATPPLPDDVDEDRLTPPITKKLQKIQRQSQIPIWKGVINMADVARFTVACFEVSGKPMFTKDEIQPIVDVIGRIPPDNVWSYIAQQKKSGSKEILVVRFQPSNEDEKAQYIAFYSYLSSKRRYGVVHVKPGIALKDFYIVPLASHTPIPQVLLPLDGPGFEESRPHMLIGVIVRTRRKKIYDPSAGTWIINEAPKPRTYSFDNFEDKGSVTEADDSIEELSYTPPPSFGHEDKLNDSTIEENHESEPYSPPSEEVTIQAEDSFSKEEAEEQDRLDRESLLAELNRTIERDKKELSEMQRKMEMRMEEQEREIEEETENSESVIPGAENIPLDTSKISIPSNLHEILNSIKQKEVAIKEKEDEIKRRLNMVEDDRRDIFSGSKDVDLRLLLPQNPELIGTGQDQDMRLLTNPPRIPIMVESGQKDLRSRDPRIVKSSICDPSLEDVPTLSSMTDADLLAKAMEMEGPSLDESHFMPPRNGPLPYSGHPPHHLLPNPILNPEGLAPPRFGPHDVQRPPYGPPEQLPHPPPPPPHQPLLNDPSPHLNYNNSGPGPGPNHHIPHRNSHSPLGIPPLIDHHRGVRGEYPPFSNCDGDLRQKNNGWNERGHVRDHSFDPRGRQGPPNDWEPRYDGGWNSGRQGFPIPPVGGPERFHPPAGPDWAPPHNQDNFYRDNRKRRYPGGRRPPMNFPPDQHKRRDQRW